jgi:hypothetical protein
MQEAASALPAGANSLSEMVFVLFDSFNQPNKTASNYF